jgi:hypothetical protein
LRAVAIRALSESVLPTNLKIDTGEWSSWEAGFRG